jgi:hypothetical protein
MGIHIRAYDKTGAALGILSDFQNLSEQVSDDGSGVLTFDYLRDGVNVGWLDRDELLLCVVENGVAHPDYFMLEEDVDDEASAINKRRFFKVSARHYMGVLDQAVVYPHGHNAAGTNLYGLKPEKSFNDRSPGGIMSTLLGEAKARGCFPELTWSFTSANDSAGRAWPKVYDITYPSGTNYLQVLMDMVDAGWVDARMEQRVLKLYVPDTYFGDTGYMLRYGQSVMSAPRKRSRRDIFSHVLTAGNVDKKANTQVVNSTTASRFGRREGYVADTRLTTTASLNSLGNRELTRHQQQREGFTLDMVLDPPGDDWWPRPGKDFKVGDKIYYDRYRASSTTFQPCVVRSMSWQWGDTKSPPTCSIELNDIFVKNAIKTSKTIASSNGGNKATTPSPVISPVIDRIAPQSPAMVTVTGSSQLVTTSILDPVYRSTATVSWDAVELDGDGAFLDDFNMYEVSFRLNGGAWSAVMGTKDISVEYGNLRPGQTVQARVRTMDQTGNRSSWTTSDTATMPIDETPPNKPSKPILSTRAGTVTVTWDGLTDTAGSMPADFRFVEVEQCSEATFTAGPRLVDRIFMANGSVVVSGQPYGAPWFYRLIAVDVVGNRSAASASASIATAPTVTADLGNDIISDLDQAMTSASDANAAAAAALEVANAAATQADFDTAMADLDANYYTKGETNTQIAMTAATKNAVIYSTSDPSGTSYTAGDIWRKVDTLATGGKILGEWTFVMPGATWVTRAYSGAILTALDAATITTGFLDAARINTNSLTIGQVSGLQGGLDSKVPTIGTNATSKVFRNVLQTINLGTANVAGSIVIKTPITFGNYMTRMKVLGYQYVSGGSDMDLDVGFYAYQATSSMVNQSLRVNGSYGATARYAKDAAGKAVIILDPPSGQTWQYPRIEIPEVSIGLTTPPDSFGTGWSAAIETDLTPYTIFTTPITLDVAGGSRLANGWRMTGKTTINGGQLETDTVLASAIKANQIGVRHLAVGDMSNYCELDEVTAGAVSPDAGITHVIETLSSVRWSKRSATTGQYFFFRNNHGPLPFKAGDRLRLTFEAFADANVTPSPYVWTYGTTNVTAQFAAAPTPLGGSAWPTQITTAAQSFAYEVTIPALTDQSTFLIGLNGIAGRDVRVKNVRCYRMGAGELIVDGSIEGKQIKANSITADRIIASGLTITTSQVTGLDTTLASKARTFTGTSVPVATAAGDLWVNTTGGLNKIYRAASAGADAITAGEWELVSDPTLKTTTFAQDAIPVATAVGDLWVNTTAGQSNKMYRAASVGADAIVAGEWVLVNDPTLPETNAKNYADTTYGATKTRVNTWTFSGQTTIDGGQIQTDTIDAVAIKAHTIGADQLVIGGVTNLVPNGTGEWGTLGGLFATTSSLTFDSTDKPSGLRGAFKSVAGAPTYIPTGTSLIWWDVEPDSEFLVECWVKADRPNSRMYVELRDQDGAVVSGNTAIPGETSAITSGSYPLENAVLTTTWTRYSAKVKPSAGTTRMRVGNVYFNHSAGTERGAVQSIAIRVRGRGTGRLLVDGTIEGKQIKANSINTDHLQVGSVQAEKLSLGVLSTNLVRDPGFEDSYTITNFTDAGQGQPQQWRKETSGLAGGTVYRAMQKARSGWKRLVLANETGDTTTVVRAYSSTFLLEAGKTYRVNWYDLSNGTGATGVNVPKLTVDAIFGPTESTLNPASAVAVSDGTLNPTYTAYADLTPESYDHESGDIVVAAGATDLYCALRFTLSNNVADTYVYVDDVSVIEAGAGGASELTAAGLRVFDANGDEATALVANRANYFTVMKAGVPRAAIDDDGEAAFQGVAVLGDESDTTSLGDVRGLSIGGTDVADRFSSLGQGMVARGYMSSKTFGPIFNEVGLFEVGFVAAPGREYLVTFDNYYIQFNPGTASGTTVPGASMLIRYTTDGSAPNVTGSPVLCYTNVFSPRGGGNDMGGAHLAGSFAVGGETEKQVRIMVCAGVGYQGTEGTATRLEVFSYAVPMQLRVFDLGPWGYENLAIETRGGGAYAGGTVVAPPPAKKTYTSSWIASSTQTRRGSGSSFGSYTVNPTSYTGSTKMLAGYYSSSNANQYDFIAFSSANSTGSETGKTISQALSGATVSKVELYVKNSSFYNSSGGQQRFAMTSFSSMPSSGTATAPPSVTYTANQSFTVGQGKWITLPSAAASVVLSGGRVAMIGPGSSTSKTYYSGWANEDASSGKPQLRITYTR